MLKIIWNGVRLVALAWMGKDIAAMFQANPTGPAVVNVKSGFNAFIDSVKINAIPLLVTGLLTAFITAAFSRGGLKKFFGWAIFIGLILYPFESQVLQATILFTAAGGVGITTTQTITYLPQYLIFTAAIVPTSVRVSVLGELEIDNLDGAGVDALNDWRKPADATSGGLYVLPLANGLIKGVNVQISFTNNGVPAIILYGGSSNGIGSKYLQTMQNEVIANTGMIIEDFLTILIPAATGADYADVNFSDGGSDRWEVDVLNLQSNLIQFEENPQIDNANGNIVKANFVPAADRQIYLARYIDPGTV